MTYLEMVNRVLRRMREKEVSSVSSTSYSRLIGDLLNDVKDEVEQAWNWSSLRYTFKAETVPSLLNYVLVGAKQGSRLINAWNDTDQISLKALTTEGAERLFLQQRDPGSPSAYSFNGVNADDYLQVDVWPIPNGVYELTFNMFVPQDILVNDGTKIRVPWKPVVEGTVARAIQERGDDGSTGAELQNARYKQALSDAIASDANQHDDEVTWVAV